MAMGRFGTCSIAAAGVKGGSPTDELAASNCSDQTESIKLMLVNLVPGRARFRGMDQVSGT